MKNIEILRVIPLRGPNIWTYRAALEVWVDIGELEECPSNTLPGFYERLLSFLPGLMQHRCGVGEPGGFMLRVREGTWPAHILEHVTLELQNLVGMQTGFGKARSTSRRGVYKVVVRSRQHEVSRACLFAGRDLVMAAIEDRPFDMGATLAHLRDMADSLCLGPSTACIVNGATERRIPSTRLSEGNLVQLGYGARSRRIWTAETDQTSAIAESISSDKDLTKQLLSSCGLPVPEGRIVANPEEAWEAAEDIGLPVAVKPTDGNHGRGISLELGTREEVEAAYALAAQHGSDVMVERFVPGNEHRLLVVGNRVVAAARGETAWVSGDGRSTVRELIERQINSDPRRGVTEEFPLNRLDLDEDRAVCLELERQGLGPDAVPEAGRKVLIQRNGNVAFDVTERVHPEVAEAAALAARIVGLDIAGVDLVVEDVSQPLAPQRGAIVEVNAGPGLLMHLKPAEGTAQPVGEAIVDHLFPQDDNGRIPIVGITGSKGKTTVARLVARMLKLSARNVGMACSDGLFFGRREARHGNAATWEAAHAVLLNRQVDAAVCENGLRTLLANGLPYDRCLIGVVTNILPDGNDPEYFIEEPGQVFNALRAQIDVVLDEGAAILNADDALVADMAELSDGEVLFFSLDANNPVVTGHLAEGGRAVFVRDQRVIMAQGSTEDVLLDVSAIAILAHMRDHRSLGSVLAAVGAAWAMGISRDLIAAVIATFERRSREDAAPVTA